MKYFAVPGRSCVVVYAVICSVVCTVICSIGRRSGRPSDRAAPPPRWASSVPIVRVCTTIMPLPASTPRCHARDVRQDVAPCFSTSRCPAPNASVPCCRSGHARIPMAVPGQQQLERAAASRDVIGPRNHRARQRDDRFRRSSSCPLNDVFETRRDRTLRMCGIGAECSSA
jgi:hypothetical protein